MGRPRVSRTIAIGVASAAIHICFLSALAIEVARPGPIGSPELATIQVTLQRLPEPAPEQKTMAAPRKARPGPRKTAPEATAAPIVDHSAKPVAPEGDISAAAIGNLVRALRGSVGCSNPDAVDLTPAERDACRQRLPRWARRGQAGFRREPQAESNLRCGCEAGHVAAAAIPGGNADERLSAKSHRKASTRGRWPGVEGRGDLRRTGLSSGRHAADRTFQTAAAGGKPTPSPGAESGQGRTRCRWMVHAVTPAGRGFGYSVRLSPTSSKRRSRVTPTVLGELPSSK